jgi:DNA-binding transcriptional regulator YbjK
MAITTPSGARPRGAARRDALLDAVLRIVAEVGTDAVTHRRVAEVAGLPLASTTYWFESKEHLLTAALERAAERDIERLTGFPSDPAETDDPLALAIDVILGPVEERDQCNRGSLLAIYALMLEAARRPALRAINKRWTDAYLDVLERLLALAGSRDARADAAILLAAADGLLVEQLTSSDTSDAAPQLRRLATALVTS